jgi:carbohydrate-selective porin OprB
MKTRNLLLLILFFCFTNIAAQQTGNEEKGLAELADSSYSNYKNTDGMGGPKSVGAQLEVDNQDKAFYFRVPIRVMKPWYDWKAQLNKDHGIQLGINYTSIYISSSEVIGEGNRDNSSSGIFDFQLGWNFLGRKSGNDKGTIFLKINSRHAYGNYTNPMFHGIFESGYYGLPAVGFNDYSIRILELNWQQSLFEDKLNFVVGKVDPTNYFNFHGIVVPWQHFMGYGASLSGTVNWPNQGIGIIASYKLSEKVYAMAGLTDVYGDLFEEGNFLHFGENFFNGKFFKAVEVGYVPSMAQRYFRKISITYWHTDAYTNPAGSSISSGSGLAFSGHWFIDETYIPYVRFGFSNGNGENAFYKTDIQLGNGFRFRSHDILGIGLSWAETNIPDTDNQMTAEVFYRFNLTAHLELTPDLQYIINPTFNPDKSSLVYFAFRGRITL